MQIRKSILCLATLATACAMTLAPAAVEDNGFDAVDGPNVRVMRHDDGGRTVFTRSPDQRTLTKRTFGANRNLTMVTIYRMDENGNPLSCKIFDGQRTELYKSSYGYHRQTGQLIEERMFDARVKRIDEYGREIPVRRFIYTYDEAGNRNHPIAINLLPGEKAEDFFNVGPSALERDPFLDQGGQAPLPPGGGR